MRHDSVLQACRLLDAVSARSSLRFRQSLYDCSQLLRVDSSGYAFVIQRIVQQIAIITDQKNGSVSPSPPDVFGSPPQLAVRKRNIQYRYLE
jgi:hypothetical protein